MPVDEDGDEDRQTLNAVTGRQTDMLIAILRSPA